jgi:hypothetical protein
MEEQLNQYFLEYEELLKTKNYNMLSESELSIVSRFSTNEEYNRIRKIILLNKEITDKERKTVEPNPDILNNIITIMKSKKDTSTVFHKIKNIFEYRIPAYNFALFAAASIIIFILILNREKMINFQKPVYISKTDTIEKYMEEEGIHNNQKPVQISLMQNNEPKPMSKETTPDVTKTSYYNTSSLNNLKLLQIKVDIKGKIEILKPKERTVHEDSSISKYFDTI